ncbi:MAG: hypothetical protein IT427_06080 [Pirellulales bacterium]|nr:hypothetical protein [Pirellulales bacterium]
MIHRIAAGLLLLAFAAASSLADQTGDELPKPNAAHAVPIAPEARVPQPEIEACGPCCGYRAVEQTVLQPVFVHSKRKVQVVEYRAESRRRIVRVQKPVYESKMVEREITVLVPERRTRTETYTVCKPVIKQDECGCCVTKYIQEQKTCEVPYIACVPTKKSISVPVTTCHFVPEERTMDYLACVPVNVEREVDACICRMVPKKVMLHVPVCPPACGACCY